MSDLFSERRRHMSERLLTYAVYLLYQAEMDMQSEDICPKKEGMPWQDHAREEEFAESRPARFLGRRERSRIVWS